MPRSCLAASALHVTLSAAAAPPLEPAQMTVLFQEDAAETSAWIRCAFSKKHDLLLNYRRKSAENSLINSYDTRLIERSTKLTPAHLPQGELIHQNGDDATPWHINGTYIGGNHGCSSVVELTVADNAVSDADIGSGWRDEAGTLFFLISVPAPGKAWLLSENLAEYPFWKFNSSLTGNALTRADGGARLDFTAKTLTQLWPCARIKEQRFLANGKTPLPSGEVVNCAFLEIIEDYEIINPAAVLAEIIKHPGRKADFVAPHLDAVIGNRLVTRITPNAAAVTTHHATALQPFHLSFMGFIQQAALERPPSGHLRYYIPKATPFVRDGTAYDFAAIQNFDTAPAAEICFTGDDAPGQRHLPDRFIQLLGEAASASPQNRLGFAFGYALTTGLTAQENPDWRRKDAGFIYTSSKTYPFALDATQTDPIPVGTTFDCTVYRQYFDPSANAPATCIYWHEENTETIVYADYHQPVSGARIQLPSSLHGRPFRILEKTETLSLGESRTIPREGLEVSSDAPRGTLVIAVGGQR